MGKDKDSEAGAPRLDLNRREMLWLGGMFAAAAGTGTLFATPAHAAEQVLRIISPLTSTNWSPLKGGGFAYALNSLWWAAPMYFDAQSQIQADAFVSWAPSADSTVWTFKLDPAATFSDGSKITAADAKGSFELATMPSTKHQRIGQVLGGVVGYADVAEGRAQEISGIVALDEETLEITLASADPIFFMRLASHLLPILKPSQARDENGEEIPEWWHPDNGVVVSGPFVPSAINLDAVEGTLVPNTNYFGPAPKLQQVEIKYVGDAVTATALLQNRQFHSTTDLVTPTVVQDMGIDFASGPEIPRGHHFWLNAGKAPMDDPKVRQALIMAVDREGLISASFPDGPYKRADQILNAVPGVDPDFEAYPFDPEAAKAALAESGYGGPESLPKLMMVGISNPANEAAAQYIAEQWRQHLGIDRVDIKPNIDGYSGPDQAQVQIFRDDVATRVPDAVVYLVGAVHSKSSNAINKLGGYANAEVDRLLDEASTKAADDPERIALAQQAQKLFREDWMFIPWYHVVAQRLTVPEVQGFERNLDWQLVAPWNLSFAD